MSIFLFLKKFNKINYVYINIIILLLSNYAFANEDKMQRITNFLIDT